MRFLAAITIAIGIVVCLVVIYLVIERILDWRRRQLNLNARWVDVIHHTETRTYVSVQKAADTFTGRVVLDEHHIGFVSNTSPDWGDRVRDLRAKAWDRAIELNQPSLTE